MRDSHCKIPPEGWTCAREVGHDGPCAATRSDHAPTAVEQLPPPSVTDRDIDDAMEMMQDDFRASELAIYLAAKRQLVAALNELKAKDTELAAKDARIAELTGCKFSDRSHAALKARAEAAESRLRAVLEFAEKRWDMPTFVARLRSIVEGK